jgi:cytoskeletal protein CcmA (bactofilin family)
MLFNGSHDPLPSTPNGLATDREPALRKPNSAPARSVIDAWLMITGNLQSEGDIQVEGQVNGDIRCSHLVVAKEATINGTIVADEVVVRGRVKGKIHANRVTLQDTAFVESDIVHQTLTVEQGACFEGRARRSDDPLKVEPELKPRIVELEAKGADTKAPDKAKSKPGPAKEPAAA